MISTSRAPTVVGVQEVGGKAASLFQLLGMDCAVPPFFVIHASACRASADGLMARELRARVLDEWEMLGGADHSYAVRSSGLAEDSAAHSFAGVFDTILDVQGPDALVSAIERCWASHRSAEAAAYRQTRGVISDDGMAVVVQRMVQANWAGVCFTADPLTQALSVTVVNAVAGGGDKLVSGEVNPEEISLDTATGTILRRTRPPGAAGLPDALLAAVVRVSGRVAKSAGFPQDLEWAADADGLWLLQSRPITTVAGVVHARAMEPWGDEGAPDAPERVWTRAYADEIWTPPVSPLFYDIQHLAGLVVDYLRRSGDEAPIPTDVFKYFRAAAYCDAALVERMYVRLPRAARRAGVVALLPPERRDALLDAPWAWTTGLKRLWTFEVSRGKRWGITRNHRFLEEKWPVFLADSEPLMNVDVGVLDDAELEAHLTAIWTLAGSIGLECGVAVVYYAHDIKLLLTGLLDRWCGDGEELYGLVSAGLSASETVREADRIWEVAQALRDAGAADQAKVLTSEAFRSGAAAIGAHAATQVFDQFLAEHRHRGANYKDVVHPRWGDDPELLWMQVQAFLDEGPRPGAVNEASGRRRREAQSRILGAVRGPLAPIRRRVLRFLFKYNEIYSSLRDNHRYYYDRVWWMLRRYFVEVGHRLHKSGLIGARDDVFFLVRSEHAALIRGVLPTSVAAERVRVRREEWLATRREQPPKFLRRGYAPDDNWLPAADRGRLTGLAASPGEARGPARIVYDVAELSRLSPGDVLVTRQTDPSWTPAFARVGGLVLETGGVLAHGASLCREFGLPCVTAVERATQLIHEGDIIAISGSSGTIELISRADGSAPDLG